MYHEPKQHSEEREERNGFPKTRKIRVPTKAMKRRKQAKRKEESVKVDKER
jgi:hypothetical protein